jgi:hypothetical protein
MNQNKKGRSPYWLAAAVAAGLLASVATAAETQSSGAAADKTQDAPIANGVHAYVDPATGKLRAPTGDELRAESQAAVAAGKQRAAAAKQNGKPQVEITKRADGSIMARDLSGSFMEAVVVGKNADGSLAYSYVGNDDAEATVAKPVSPAPALEEK